MSKFLLCPELVTHSKTNIEYWLYILLVIIQKDHIKIIVDKNPHEKEIKSKIMEEYFKIAKDDKNIETWIIDVLKRKDKNIKTMNFSLPNDSDLKEDIMKIASNINAGKRTVLCKTENDYENYFSIAKANSIFFIDKDEAKDLLSRQNEREINITIDKIINRRGILSIGDKTENRMS